MVQSQRYVFSGHHVLTTPLDTASTDPLISEIQLGMYSIVKAKKLPENISDLPAMTSHILKSLGATDSRWTTGEVLLSR